MRLCTAVGFRSEFRGFDMSIFTKDQERVCPGCGNMIQSTDRFCKYCGRSLVPSAPEPAPSPKQGMRQCVGCGREFPEGLKFCPYCGTPTAGAAPPKPDTLVPTSVQPSPIPEPPAPMPVPVPAAPPAPAPQPAPRPLLKCVGCGRDIPEGSKFCPYCARPNPFTPAPVAPPQPAVQAPPVAVPNPAPAAAGMERCNACGKEIPSGLKYCPYCGRLAAKPLDPAARPDAPTGIAVDICPDSDPSASRPSACHSGYDEELQRLRSRDQRHDKVLPVLRHAGQCADAVPARTAGRNQDMPWLREGDIDNTRFLPFLRVSQEPKILLNEHGPLGPLTISFLLNDISLDPVT